MGRGGEAGKDALALDQVRKEPHLGCDLKGEPEGLAAWICRGKRRFQAWESEKLGERWCHDLRWES